MSDQAAARTAEATVAPSAVANAAPAAASTALRLLLLSTMAAWGANLAIVKLLIQVMEPLLVSALRMVVATAAVLAVLAWQRVGWPQLARRQWGLLVLGGVLMVYLNQICFTEGVARTQAANAALIIALNPLLSSLLAGVSFGERIGASRLAGVVLGFSGVAAVVLNRPGAALGSAGWGDLLVFASVSCWVAGGALVQRLGSGIDPVQVSCVLNLVGTPLLALHVALMPHPLRIDWPNIGWDTAALVLVSAVFAMALGGVVWNRALAVLGVARTALYAYWVPIFGVLFAVALLGEPLSPWHGVGLAAVLGGTWLGTRGR